MRTKTVLLTLLGLGLILSPVFAATYKVDEDHTTVGFKARHLFSNVVGAFDKFEGTIDYEPGKPETWKAQGTIQAASIDTKVEKRDEHLRSPDFFDVQKYPTITFKTTKVTDVTDKTAKVEGLINIHGVEKPIVLDVTINGTGKDPWGNTRTAFTATTKINRKDFGINWNQTLDNGGVLVGEDVEITLEVEGILQQ